MDNRRRGNAQKNKRNPSRKHQISHIPGRLPVMSPMKSRKNIPASYLTAAKRMEPVLAVKMNRGNVHHIVLVEKFVPNCL